MQTKGAAKPVFAERRTRETIVRYAPWVIGLVSIALMIGLLILTYIDRAASLPHGYSEPWNFSNVFNNVVNLAVPIIGIVLASRRPENRIGWLFLGAGFSLGLSTFGTAYGLHALVVHHGSFPLGHVFAWASNWTWAVAIAALAFLFLLFPTGRLPSPRWRVPARVVGVAMGILTAEAILFATLGWNHPFRQTNASGALALLGFLAFALPLIIALAISLVAVVVRFRSSVGDERLQLKWFAAGALLVFITEIAGIFSSSQSILEGLAFMFLYAAIGIAVLKYRLYEIDVVISKTVVYGVLAAFFTLIYVAVVVGVGTIIGSRRNPFLTLLAAAVIAVAFNPVRDRARRLANRIVYGKRASPYEVLSNFSERVAGTYAVEEVLPRMAAILGEGTGAREAQVWLRVAGELRPAAEWGESRIPAQIVPLSDGEMPAIAGPSKVVAVRHQSELLGALTVTKPPNEPMTSAEDKLMDDLASQAGLVLRNVRLTEELRAKLEELRASRQRLVTAQDQARRRLERNIHDGAQQHLVSLAVTANLAASMVGKNPQKEGELIDQLKTGAQEALENLRDLARGIYPPLLADRGLAVALEAQAMKSPVPITVTVETNGRYTQEAEAGIYFCCLEAMQNITKYSGAASAQIRLSYEGGDLCFEVTDDGQGFDPAATGYGTGLQGMADRLDALGGAFEVHSRPGEGTTVSGRVPATSNSKAAVTP
ncbi:MAG TPA: histidine kinase [Actinomycetota bacterium]|nr:histidine kinase [Actinomycetota bacterium]